MTLNATVIAGNLTEVKHVSNGLTTLRIARYNFSNNENAKPVFDEIKTFERQAPIVAQLEEMIAARRQETGNENSALKNVKILAYVDKQGKDGGYKYQAILSRVMVDKKEVLAPGQEAFKNTFGGNLNHVHTFGNVVEIKKVSDKLTTIKLARANFSDNADAPTTYDEIKAFGRHEAIVAELEAKLAARRQETGNENSALTQVNINSFVSYDANYDMQLVLESATVNKVPVAKPAKTEVKAEAKPEAKVEAAEVKAEAVEVEAVVEAPKATKAEVMTEVATEATEAPKAVEVSEQAAF